MNIIYPPHVDHMAQLKIGVPAPSSGVVRNSISHQRLEQVMHDFRLRGVQLSPGACLLDAYKHISASSACRATEFFEMWCNPAIHFIFPPWGGEFLIDILPHIDFQQLKSSPTWVQGFSDISTLLFSITVCTGIATAHGTNLIDSINGQDRLTRQSLDYLTVKSGGCWTQISSDQWQVKWPNYADNIRACYQTTEQTYWRVLNRQGMVQVSGRLIGGCLDTIGRLAGTMYGNLPQFAAHYCQHDGVLLYFESCHYQPPEVFRALSQLKLAGWFTSLAAVIIGRSPAKNKASDCEVSFDEAVHQIFIDFNVPIIVDADIGHQVPQMTLINGSLACLTVVDGRATLTQKFM